jgi:hypothetical protein
LGLNGPAEVKEHPWFKDFDWKALETKIPVSPFIPPNEDNFDAKYTNADWKDNNSEAMRQHSMMLKRGSVQALFQGYYHDDNLAAINNDNTKGVLNLKDFNDQSGSSQSSIKEMANSSGNQSFVKESTDRETNPQSKLNSER